jgi:hypothetical protein
MIFYFFFAAKPPLYFKILLTSGLSQNLVKLSRFLKISYPLCSKPTSSPTPPQNKIFSFL